MLCCNLRCSVYYSIVLLNLFVGEQTVLKLATDSTNTVKSTGKTEFELSSYGRLNYVISADFVVFIFVF